MPTPKVAVGWCNIEVLNHAPTAVNLKTAKALGLTVPPGGASCEPGIGCASAPPNISLATSATGVIHVTPPGARCGKFRFGIEASYSRGKMRRREFITLLGGAAAWPLAGRAQTKVPTIGVLVVGSPSSEKFWRIFREALRELGYVEGYTVRFEFRSDQGQGGRLPELAAELVRLKVDVIVAWFTPAARAAKEATREIPVVMAGVGDPVATGLVESLARPGGNVTGTGALASELAGKCVELIREMLPSAHRIAALVNTPDPFSKPFLEKIRLSGEATGTMIDPIMIRDPTDIDAGFLALQKALPHAVIVQPSLPAKRIADLALTYRIPAVSHFRPFVEDGGLMSYWWVEAELYRRSAVFVDKILKGTKPGDLPVEQPTRFELVINLKTAKALGITLAPAMLSRADEVIE
jgi:putative ABC transport system substrate-binding protein